jgi:hypothetical protein
MSTFTFDFDLQDDLDESFDAISLQDPRPIQSSSSIEKQLLPAEEIPLSALVRRRSNPLSYISIRYYSSPRSQKRSHILLSHYLALITQSRDETSSMRVSNFFSDRYTTTEMQSGR